MFNRMQKKLIINQLWDLDAALKAELHFCEHCEESACHVPDTDDLDLNEILESSAGDLYPDFMHFLL